MNIKLSLITLLFLLAITPDAKAIPISAGDSILIEFSDFSLVQAVPHISYTSVGYNVWLSDPLAIGNAFQVEMHTDLDSPPILTSYWGNNSGTTGGGGGVPLYSHSGPIPLFGALRITGVSGLVDIAEVSMDITRVVLTIFRQ
jgi:hypothetical protein